MCLFQSPVALLALHPQAHTVSKIYAVLGPRRETFLQWKKEKFLLVDTVGNWRE